MQIEEAKARLAAAMKDSPELSNTFSADFIANGDIGDRVWEDEAGPYGAVTCMFALHYFFRSEESAMKAIAMAAKNLKRHGYFFGVLPDGKNVLNAIGESMKPKQFKAVRMAPRWVGVPQPFGSAYTCALTDTVTEVWFLWCYSIRDNQKPSHFFWSEQTQHTWNSTPYIPVRRAIVSSSALSLFRVRHLMRAMLFRAETTAKARLSTWCIRGFLSR